MSLITTPQLDSTIAPISSGTLIESTDSRSIGSHHAKRPCAKDYGEYIMDTFLVASSTIVDGEYPLDARIIFIGDSDHSDASQDAARSTIINHYAKKGDIILCEAVAALKSISMKKHAESLPFSSKHELRCLGWDDGEQSRLHGIYLSALLEMCDKYHLTSSDSESDPLPLTPPDQALFEEYGKAFDLCTQKRTESLIRTAKTVLKKLKPGQKIFVVAGSEHLTNVLYSFKNDKAALIIPKVKGGQLSVQAALRYLEKATT